MNWNYRILAHESKGGIYFQIHEVYYENKIPNGYTDNPVIIESDILKGIKWTLKQMKKATKKPILWYGKSFPNEYKI